MIINKHNAIRDCRHKLE